MRWNRADLLPLHIEIDEAEGLVATFAFGTPVGMVRLLAEISEAQRTLILSEAHIEGPGGNALGPANLRFLAELVMEELDYDAIDIQGAPRTTGANPSHDHRPRYRFTRRHPPDV